MSRLLYQDQKQPQMSMKQMNILRYVEEWQDQEQDKCVFWKHRKHDKMHPGHESAFVRLACVGTWKLQCAHAKQHVTVEGELVKKKCKMVKQWKAQQTEGTGKGKDQAQGEE